MSASRSANYIPIVGVCDFPIEEKQTVVNLTAQTIIHIMKAKNKCCSFQIVSIVEEGLDEKSLSKLKG